MKYFDLIVVSGSKASEKQIFQLLSGKNQIGTNIKCSTQLDLKQIQPQHFELLVTTAGRITLIPLVKNMQIKNTKSSKLIELQPNQCYDVEKDQAFYINRTYSCSIQERITKKSTSKAESSTTNSLWTPNQKDKLRTPNKKIKIEEKLVKQENESQETQSQTNEDEVGKNDEDEQFEEEHVYKRKAKKPEKQTQKKIINKIPNKKDNKNNSSSCETSVLVDEKKQKQQKPKTKQTTCRVILSNCELTKTEKQKMIELGVTFVENPDEEFDVVVMETFRRRAKLLIGLNKQAWIVNKNWILDCIDDKELIDEYEEYFLELSKEDKKKYKDLDLDEVQKKSSKNKGFQIFKNQKFQLQPLYTNVSLDDLESIIKNGGGNIINKETNNKKNVKYYHVIEKEDVSKLKGDSKNITFIDPEYILLSSLKQQPQQQFIYKN